MRRIDILLLDILTYFGEIHSVFGSAICALQDLIVFQCFPLVIHFKSQPWGDKSTPEVIAITS